ncbi:MAG: hypothetical protein Q8R76_03370 [Candidatus Omnitrophota bacterium]|nr:hypothetical protein [Candidatus Omnitrophota bacterium]
MDKKRLYENTEKILNQAFEAAKHSVKVVSEKAGEAAHVTGLLIEKATLEHRVAKRFAQLGNRIYEKSTREGNAQFLEDPEVNDLVERTKKLDAELAQVEATLEAERKERSAKRGS